MTKRLFTGERSEPFPETPQIASSLEHEYFLKPENYVTDPDLAETVDLAIMLAKPLLVTGKPGTGKTQLAERIKWELNLARSFKFETKSTSVARDIFYYYDYLGRFYDAQIQRKKMPVDYLIFNALGLAILHTLSREKIEHVFPENTKWENYPGPCRSVVLIDEIDKAPRDFPNDILNEIEHMYFRIPELGNTTIKADINFYPIIIITSNSEKNLPDTFLRRCIFHNIEFPTRDRMLKIIDKRIRDLDWHQHPFINETVDLFYEFRTKEDQFQKIPATSELLTWLTALRIKTPQTDTFLNNPQLIKNTLGILFKTEMDRELACEIVDIWLSKKLKKNSP